MQYTINELRMALFHDVYQVYEVFQNYFGEDFTDLQGLPDDSDMEIIIQACDIEESEHEHIYNVSDAQLNMAFRTCAVRHPFILVYWPRVMVTNENNRSITIQDLYAKIELDARGFIPTENTGFLLNRATYPMDQWVCGYLHSHISSIPKRDPQSFMTPCLGTGPIRDTIYSLKAYISEGFDEIMWMLFCEELSRYVTVESLTGIPYKHLEDVHLSDALTGFRGYGSSNMTGVCFFEMVLPISRLKDFILYYLSNGHLSISYQGGIFKVGMSYFDYMIDISNSFIEYFNSHYDSKSIADSCFSNNVLYHAVVSGGKFYKPSTSMVIPDVSMYVGKKVCTFKGRDVTLNILPASEKKEKRQETTVLNHSLAMYILNNILRTINYRYTNGYTRQHCQDSTAALPAPTGQRAYYI